MSQNIAIFNQLNPLDFLAKADIGEKTKVQYRRILTRAINHGVVFGDLSTVERFLQTGGSDDGPLPNSGKALFKSAIRLWGKEITRQAKNQASPDNIATIQAIIYQIEGLNETLTTKTPQGQKTHTWLNKGQITQLYDYCRGITNKCKRDRLIIGLLVGAGLRRDELVNLTFEQVKEQSYGDKDRTVLAIEGKGKKKRTVPISDNLALAIEQWQGIINDNGPIIRSVNKSDKIGNKLSGFAVAKIVAQAGKSIELKDELAPHDLRRTFARIAYDNGLPIGKISILLGHENVETTQRYINIELKLDVSACDFIPAPPVDK